MPPWAAAGPASARASAEMPARTIPSRDPGRVASMRTSFARGAARDRGRPGRRPSLRKTSPAPGPSPRNTYAMSGSALDGAVGRPHNSDVALQDRGRLVHHDAVAGRVDRVARDDGPDLARVDLDPVADDDVVGELVAAAV